MFYGTDSIEKSYIVSSQSFTLPSRTLRFSVPLLAVILLRGDNNTRSNLNLIELVCCMADKTKLDFDNHALTTNPAGTRHSDVEYVRDEIKSVIFIGAGVVVIVITLVVVIVIFCWKKFTRYVVVMWST